MFLVPSCSCLCPIHWTQVLSREWRCSWSSADRQCSNYIFVINKYDLIWSSSLKQYQHKFLRYLDNQFMNALLNGSEASKMWVESCDLLPVSVCHRTRRRRAPWGAAWGHTVVWSTTQCTLETSPSSSLSQDTPGRQNSNSNSLLYQIHNITQ